MGFVTFIVIWFCAAVIMFLWEIFVSLCMMTDYLLSGKLAKIMIKRS